MSINEDEHCGALGGLYHVLKLLIRRIGSFELGVHIRHGLLRSKAPEGWRTPRRFAFGPFRISARFWTAAALRRFSPSAYPRMISRIHTHPACIVEFFAKEIPTVN
jgi:hypothetical protein